jgi:hypothetical protein
MQHGVLVAADVHVHRQPAPGALVVERAGRRTRSAVAQVAPRRVDEGVADVGLPAGGLAADRAGNVDQSSAAASGEVAVPSGRNSSTSGRSTGSWSSGDAHRPVGGAVDDGDRRPPATLPGDQPVAQPVLDGGLAAPQLAEPLDHTPPALRRGGAVEAVGVPHRPLAGVGLPLDVAARPAQCGRMRWCMELSVDSGAARRAARDWWRRRAHRPAAPPRRAHAGARRAAVGHATLRRQR